MDVCVIVDVTVKCRGMYLSLHSSVLFVLVCMTFVSFFFSSRRRHTRYWRLEFRRVLFRSKQRTLRLRCAYPPGRTSWHRNGETSDWYPPPSPGHARPGVPNAERCGGRSASDRPRSQIGRASCRERVENSVVAVSLKKKQRT